jgi:hypothetical protein
MADLKKGVAGVSKALLGLDPTPEAVRQQRLQACRACPNRASVAGLAVCGLCGCFVRFKVRLYAEECPDTPPRWPD